MREPYFSAEGVTLYFGDCRTVVGELSDACVEAVVTDPPYELGFMGKGWDGSGIAYDIDLWREVMRVLKPGGHLLAFGGTRTWHRLACAIEDAGFELRDSIAWMYGSGFPKSLDVSKAIDKQRDDRADILRVTAEIARLRDEAGLTNRDLDDAFGFAGMAGHWTSTKSQPAVPRVEQWAILRDMLNPDPWLDHEVWRLNGRKGEPGEAWKCATVIGIDERWNEPSGIVNVNQGVREKIQRQVKSPATPDAARWQGWGTALKPAFEPVVVARKPLIGTVAENVLAHGTGALNIDGCRIGTTVETWPSSRSYPYGGDVTYGSKDAPTEKTGSAPAGRWPANVILDESQAAELDRQSGVAAAKPERVGRKGGMNDNGTIMGAGSGSQNPADYVGTWPADLGGGASRFFYVPKANSSERPRVGEVAHPTVKPLELMRYLVRLVTPPGGTVLEPFAGSGTTLEACLIEGFNVIGIELTEDYLPLIVSRISKPIEAVLL